MRALHHTHAGFLVDALELGLGPLRLSVDQVNFGEVFVGEGILPGARAAHLHVNLLPDAAEQVALVFPQPQHVFHAVNRLSSSNRK